MDFWIGFGVATESTVLYRPASLYFGAIWLTSCRRRATGREADPECL